MRNQLVSYVNLLFAGNPEAADIKEEILQNTLDRYDDMIAQGRTPEAAYSLAISGIGDISELLHGNAASVQPSSSVPREPEESEKKKTIRKLLRAVAIGLYILCPVPLFIFQDEIGLSLLLAVVALATVLIIFASKGEKKPDVELTPQQKIRKSISDLIWTIGTIVYFVVSFTTFAWHITWLIFPLLGAIDGLISACMDLKEEK